MPFGPSAHAFCTTPICARVPALFAITERTSVPLMWLSKTGAPLFSRSSRAPAMSSCSMYSSPVSGSVLGTVAPPYQTTSTVRSSASSVVGTNEISSSLAAKYSPRGSLIGFLLLVLREVHPRGGIPSRAVGRAGHEQFLDHSEVLLGELGRLIRGPWRTRHSFAGRRSFLGRGGLLLAAQGHVARIAVEDDLELIHQLVEQGDLFDLRVGVEPVCHHRFEPRHAADADIFQRRLGILHRIHRFKP